jgi:hypothetical protein
MYWLYVIGLLATEALCHMKKFALSAALAIILCGSAHAFSGTSSVNGALAQRSGGQTVDTGGSKVTSAPLRRHHHHRRRHRRK